MNPLISNNYSICFGSLYLVLSMSKPEHIIIDKVIGYKEQLGSITITHKDLILYALGIGFSTDPYNLKDFKFTYEYSQNFSSFPTIASCFGQTESINTFLANPYLPQFELHTVLHGQQKLHMVHKSIKLGATYCFESQIIDLVDKGKGAIIVNRINGYLINQNKQKELAYYLDRTTFCRTLGGSGFKGNGKHKNIENAPKRKPDIILKDKTFANQALLYRLNSDPNSLHVDPNIAKLVGFERPIIHGLATYGIVCRSIVQNILNYDAQAVESYQVRFTGHVFPGEQLQIKVWKEGSKLFFEVQVLERKTKAIVGVLTIRTKAKL